MHIKGDELVDSLRRRGLRLTAPRKAICQVLASSHDEHLTAADLGDKVEELLGRAVDLATIYRTIDVLEQAGHVHHVHFGHGPGVVHLADEVDHHHMACDSCGRTVDIPIEEVTALLSSLEERYGFSGGSTHFALMGRCASCD